MSWLRELAQSTCVPEQSSDVWACSHNYLFEERLTDERHKQYEDHCAEKKVSAYTSWTEAHTGYVQKNVKCHRPDVAETFKEINAKAQTDLSNDVFVLRCEDLTRPLKEHRCELKQLQDWLAMHDGQLQRKHIKSDYARAKLRDFLDDWNGRRRLWPAFAAFEHELGDAHQLVKQHNWPETLRNRLGMAHYDGKLSIPVALMRVPAWEIKAAASAQNCAAFAQPTVLDGNFNHYYHPTPADFSFGASIHLDPQLCGQRMTAEILFLPLDYRLEHLVAVSYIDTPLPAHNLCHLRNRHLLGLRQEPGASTFGDLIRASDCTGGGP